MVNKKWHQSQRGFFAGSLYQQMKINDKIMLLVGDLGFGVFDNHFADFPDRCTNTGASEQALVGMAIGMSYEGLLPFVYSISTFLFYRPFELLRNYVNHEEANIKLIGSGRDKDYLHDGISHWATDINLLFGKNKFLNNIVTYWPNDKKEIPQMVSDMIASDKPGFISLQR